MIENKIYLIIRHKSGRAFSLNRNYKIIKSDFNCEKPGNFSDYWKGWLPTEKFQRPEWIKEIPENEFTAYWMY
jgi:hypothetical protein